MEHSQQGTPTNQFEDQHSALFNGALVTKQGSISAPATDLPHCMAAALNRQGALSSDAVSALMLAEDRVRLVNKEEHLCCPEQNWNELYTVVEGWACSYRQLLDGQCQILDIYLPGDVVGLSELQSSSHADGIMMISKGKVRPFRRDQFVNLIRELPRIHLSVMQLMGEEQARRNERIINLGAKNALARLCHFYAELSARSAPAGQEPSDQFDLPLSQQQIGEALGMTAVHVRRCLSKLREMEVISHQRGSITILDRDRLEELGEVADEHPVAH